MDTDFSFRHSDQAGSGSHPAPYRMGIGGKAARREADSSLEPSAEVKNGGAIPSLPLMCSWRGA
jgi:hypothetical protein